MLRCLLLVQPQYPLLLLTVRRLWHGRNEELVGARGLVALMEQEDFVACKAHKESTGLLGVVCNSLASYSPGGNVGLVLLYRHHGSWQ